MLRLLWLLKSVARQRIVGSFVSARGFMKRWMWIVINVLLAMVIAGIILATWMPALYVHFHPS
jgi:hypothetical protein